jgi:hypothetical protein
LKASACSADDAPLASAVRPVAMLPSEPPGGDIANLRVVLPAVPQPSDDFHDVGCFVEKLVDVWDAAFSAAE